MAYFLYMKQSGEGCDYTIGCGAKLVRLDAENVVDARALALAAFEDYGIDGEERSLSEACIMEIAQDVMSLAQDYVDGIIEARRERTRDEKKQQLEKLKKELGET